MPPQDVPVSSVASSFAVIEGLRKLGPAGVTELASHLGRSKSSTYKHLDTLRRLGYVEKVDGEYALGLEFFRLGYHTRHSRELYEVSQEPLDDLAVTTGETVSLIVEEGGEAICLYQATERQVADTEIQEAERLPLDASVAGRAILAWRPEDEVTELLDSESRNGYDRYRELQSDLRSIRDHHIAIERTDAAAYNGVAVPIRDVDDYAIGAVMVTGPPTSLSGKRLEEDISGLLVSAGKGIEVTLAST